MERRTISINEKINRFLRAAMEEMRHTLSDLSDVEFELATSPELGNDSMLDDIEG